MIWHHWQPEPEVHHDAVRPFQSFAGRRLRIRVMNSQGLQRQGRRESFASDRCNVGRYCSQWRVPSRRQTDRPMHKRTCGADTGQSFVRDVGAPQGRLLGEWLVRRMACGLDVQTARRALHNELPVARGGRAHTQQPGCSVASADSEEARHLWSSGHASKRLKRTGFSPSG